MIGLGGPLRRRKANAPDVENHFESSGVGFNRGEIGACGLREEGSFSNPDMSCKDRTSEFFSAVKSLQSRQVRNFRRLTCICLFDKGAIYSTLFHVKLKI